VFGGGRCSEPVTASDYLAGIDPCCNRTNLDALLESVKGTAEEQGLAKAISATEKRYDSTVQAASRSAKCCDGTESDSCLCSEVHSGCCSHHGGVCGCE
jgi:hypothetical protein